MPKLDPEIMKKYQNLLKELVTLKKSYHDISDEYINHDLLKALRNESRMAELKAKLAPVGRNLEAKKAEIIKFEREHPTYIKHSITSPGSRAMLRGISISVVPTSIFPQAGEPKTSSKDPANTRSRPGSSTSK